MELFITGKDVNLLRKWSKNVCNDSLDMILVTSKGSNQTSKDHLVNLELGPCFRKS